MPPDTQPAARPLWVRAVARDGTRRAAAATQRGLLAVLACAGLVIFGIEQSSDSALGAVARPVALAAAGFGLVGAVWTWAAVRWADRNGRWA